MTDLEEFIYLLHKHPEAIPFLREITEHPELLPKVLLLRDEVQKEAAADA